AGGQRIRARMRRAQHRVFDCDPGVASSELHRRTRLEIFRFAYDSLVVGSQEPPGLARKDFRERVATGGYVRLDRMSYGVEPGCRCNCWRLRNGKLGVE